MKKVISLLVLLLSIQTINAHATVTQHAHDSIIDQWAWILIPCIALCVLTWKLGGKNYLKILKKINIFN